LSWTGYTHQWRTCNPAYAKFCMASCETVADRRLALRLGYRNFCVRLPEKGIDRGGFVCPPSAESGWRPTCDHCKACSGPKNGLRNASPVIVVHGLQWKIDRYRDTLADLAPDRNAGRRPLPLV